MSTLAPPHVNNVSCVLTDSDLQDSLSIATNGALNIGLQVFSQLPQMLGETAAISVYSLLILLSTFLLLRKGVTSISRVTVALACIIMYTMAVTHWARGLHDYFLNVNNALELQNETVECLENISDGQSCGLTMDGVFELMGPTPDACSETAELLVTIVLGDMIVIWRAWMLWSRNRIIQGISILLVFLTLLMSALSARRTCKGDFAAGNSFVDDKFGFSAFVFSWITNIWATGLIAYQAWRYRRLIKKDLQIGSVRSRLEKALLLFVDSGVLYCALWTLLVADISIDVLVFGEESEFSIETVKWKFQDHIDLFLDSALIEVIGIYPTLLVVMVALAKSNIEKTLVSGAPPSSDNEISPRNAGLRVRIDTVADSESPGKTAGMRGRPRDTVLVLEPERAVFDSRSEYSERDEERGEMKTE